MNGPPYNTKYGLCLIILCKKYKRVSPWLVFDDYFATSKPNQDDF